MYGRIYQLSQKPLNANDFIEDSSFYPEQTEFADWLDDVDENELDVEYADMELFGMFERKEDCLVYLGDNGIKERWMKRVKEAFNSLTDISNGMQRQRLKDAVAYPFTQDRYVIEGWSSSNHCYTVEPSSEFFEFCVKNLKKGDKLYLGGVVKFHY